MGDASLLPTMPFTVLPEIADLVPVNWNVRFLARCSEEVSKMDPTGFPPLIQLMELLRDGFVDGCSMTSIGTPAPAQPSETSPSLMDFLYNLRDEAWGYAREKLIYDHRLAITYLVLPLGKLLQIDENYVILLWRHERVFSPDDVITAKIILQLFLSRFSGPSLLSARCLEVHKDLTLPILQAAALDAVAECVFICDVEGQLIYVNKRSQEALQRGASRLISTKITEFFNSVVHPDDAVDFSASWERACSEKKTVKCRCRVTVLRGGWGGNQSFLSVATVPSSEHLCFPPPPHRLDTNSATNTRGSLSRCRRRESLTPGLSWAPIWTGLKLSKRSSSAPR